MKLKTKFNSLSELVEEIDQWITILQNKKQILEYLEKKNDFESTLNKYKDKNENWKPFHNDDIITCIRSLLNSDRRNKSSFKREFTPYTIKIRPEYAKALKEQAMADGKSVSDFIKKKFLYHYIHNVDHPEYVLEQYQKYQSNIEKLTKKHEIPDTIAVALNDNDKELLRDMAAKSTIGSSREIVKLCVAKFVKAFEYGDILAKIKDYKDLVDEMKFIPCKSTNLAGYLYDKAIHVLWIKFIGGSVYKYENVPFSVYEGLEKAESKGKFFNEYIRDNKNYKYEKVR